MSPKKLYKTHSSGLYTPIDINSIHELPSVYPIEFKLYCDENKIKLPKLTCLKGIAICLMSINKYKYFNRDSCTELKKKFNINSKDIIQPFNKVNQVGIKTNSDFHDKEKYYIVYPYGLSNKPKMRKDFKFSGTEEEKNNEIDKTKSTIKSDYIDVPNHLWQLGHKNPGSIDNSNENLVLQPPIQGKYRDNYIFIDTLTKFPMPHKLEIMIEKKEIEFTEEQIKYYKQIFDNLCTSI